MTRIDTRLVGSTRLDRAAYAIVRTIVTVFCRTWCRMSVEGRENVPSEGPFLLAPIHRSILDTPIASGLTKRRMRFMGADKYWRGWFGRLLTALGAFPVSRGTADREALKRCIELLRAGEPLVLFPEGERKQGPIVRPLFDGATYVAFKGGAPIVPVAIAGSDRAMPKGAKFIRPRKVHVIVGRPLAVPSDDRGRVNRAELSALTETLHDELQRLYDQALVRVG